MFLVKIEGLSDMWFGSIQYGSGIMKAQPKSSEMTQISIDIIRVIKQKIKPPRRSVY